jgi:hypothetical protein
MNEVCNLLQAWLKDCKSVHTRCISAHGDELPSRLLHISGDLDVPIVNLIESSGLREIDYFALSHCWGPADKQPLCTTRNNYYSHLAGIPFEKLPKTFQDAVLLAQGAGVEYIWIDSLCIIQNDIQDWHTEASNMTGVYKNATLVIAASDANDSTEGLFITERSQKPIMTVPYVVDGVIQGHYNITQSQTHPKDPAEGILNTRAWALQERLLAQRIVFFMRESVYWRCNTAEFEEPGPGGFLHFYEYGSWLDLLESYCRKALTKPEDQLYALRGVAEHMKRFRKDKYFLNYGFWEDDLVTQLLWMKAEPTQVESCLGLPTWCWAATRGVKSWVRSPRLKEYRIMPRSLEIGNSGSLASVGHITTFPFTWRPVSSDVCSTIRGDLSISFNERLIVSVLLHRSVYTIEGRSNTGCIDGIAMFDSIPSQSARCFFLTSLDRTSSKYNLGNDRVSDSKVDHLCREEDRNTVGQCIIFLTKFYS